MSILVSLSSVGTEGAARQRWGFNTPVVGSEELTAKTSMPDESLHDHDWLSALMDLVPWSDDGSGKRVG